MDERPLIAEKLTQALLSYGNMELRVKEWNEYVNQPKILEKFDLYVSTETLYRESVDGSRFLETRHTSAGGKIRVQKDSLIGGRSTAVVHDRGAAEVPAYASVSRAFAGESSFGETARPAPLVYFFVGKVPLREAIEHARPVGTEAVEGTFCLRFAFDDVLWSKTVQTLVYVLEASSGTLRRVDSFRDRELKEKDRLWSWTATEFRAVGHAKFPMKSVLVAYNVEDGAIQYRRHAEVLKVDFNKNFNDVDFAPVFGPGVHVHDTIAGKAYTTPGVPKAPARVSELLPGSTAVDTAPPGGWEGYFPAASLAVGMSLLATGAALSFRRRRP